MLDSIPASYASRIRDQLIACDQPLIEVWGWPWSGKWRLLEHWASEDPGAWAGVGAADLETTVRRSTARWLVAEGAYDSEQLLRAAEVLSDEQRLILPIECRASDRILPSRWLTPSQLLLRGSEIEALFGGGAHTARVDELRKISDGWLGPLLWLREHGAPDDGGVLQEGHGPEPLEASLSSPELRAHFQQRVLDRLGPELRSVIAACALPDEVDPALWRRVWASQPRYLAEFQRLDDWGWLLSEPGRPLRLPHMLRRLARSRSAAGGREERQIYRQLGVAAHRLGADAKAEHYLRLAGEARQLALVYRLRLPAAPEPTKPPADEVAQAEPPANPPPSKEAPAATRCYRLSLLGQPVLQVIEPDGSSRELSWRLHRALLSIAYLALAPGHRATKDELVAAIWGEASEHAIRRNFHPTLSEARRALGSKRVFVYRQGIYVLNPEFEWWVDCTRFRELITAGRLLLTQQPGEEPRALDAWQEAWQLYHGPLLAGTEAAWLRPHRDSLYQDYIELLRGIGDLCSRLDRRTLALDAYRSLLLVEPFEERVHLAVMELYARQGRRDLVRQQFVRMQQLLIDELNVEPLEGTLDRYHQLMR